MRRPQTAYLKAMPEDEQLDWASDVLSEIADRHVKLQGWKIVNRDDPDWRWPFNSKTAGCAAPNWCEDLATPKAISFPPVQGRA